VADSKLDVVTIGNAIVDVITRTDDAFLARYDLTKGAMILVDAERSAYLYDKMGPGVEISGGSAANTSVGVAQLGGRAGYVGKIHDDALGEIFRHDIRAAGVQFDTPAGTAGAPTARCLIFVTEDAQRTMNTHLGACVELTPDDIEPAMIADAKVTYMEGYLWDPPQAKDAFRKALEIAHSNGRKVSLTLSDPFCVGRYRDEFLDLVENHIDLLFANEDEIISLYQADDFDAALQQVRGHCEVAALTRSAKGSVVVSGDEVHVIDAAPVSQVTDTTGAGDLFAAGFLYGYTQGYDLARCGRLAALTAAEVISHLGARPEVDISTFGAASEHPIK